LIIPKIELDQTYISYKSFRIMTISMISFLF
jgi:hypothetical protein